MRSTGIIDFHTHAFPDPVAARAIPSLEEAGKILACTDGTSTGLLASMDRAGIEHSVICSIATRVEQFQPILEWSKQIRSSRIIPLPSIHPEDPKLIDHLQTICEEGFSGIKLHPYYQNFFLAEDRLDPLYRAATEYGLMVVVHSGFDIAYPRIRRTDPQQALQVLQKFPELRLITTHFGGWDDWREVERLLIGRPIYMEISFALDFLEPEQVRTLINAHPADYLLFGTDSPWVDQGQYLQKLAALELDKALFDKIVSKNAATILRL